MADYYETLGTILRHQLNTTTGTKKKQTSYQSAKQKEISSNIFETDPNVRVPVPDTLIEDFAILHVLPGVPLSYCKQAWKYLVKKHHPDLIHDEKHQEEAAILVQRINRSYKRIETWFLTGTIAD